MKMVIAFDRGDLELQHSVDRKDPEKERLEEEKKIHNILSNMRVRIATEMHRLADNRDHMTKDEVAHVTQFIVGLKKRYNQLFRKRYGEDYYKVATAASNIVSKEALKNLVVFAAGPQDAKAYEWYAYGRIAPVTLTSARGTKARVERGDVFGIRLSAKGDRIRVVLQSKGLSEVFSLDTDKVSVLTAKATKAKYQQQQQQPPAKAAV